MLTVMHPTSYLTCFRAEHVSLQIGISKLIYQHWDGTPKENTRILMLKVITFSQY